MIIFDTETTGLLRPSATELHLQPHITEIFALKVDEDFNEVDRLETFVRSPVPISEEITKITGITNEMISHAPTFAEIYRELADFFKGEQTAVAHNYTFDHGMLIVELQRLGLEYKFPWPYKCVCTIELSHQINNKRMTLGDLHVLATGEPIENAHRASSDVLAMVPCLAYLREQGFLK